MPNIKVPKEKLKGLAPLPPGIFDFRVDGFEPSRSKKGDSVNLNPVLKVINHPQLNDRQVYENLNSQAGWVQQDFVHTLGLTMQIDGDDASMPGTFNCKTHGPADCSCDPKDWVYIGPIIGRTGRVELAETDNKKGGKKTAVKRYFCAVPGCKEKHNESLI